MRFRAGFLWAFFAATLSSATGCGGEEFTSSNGTGGTSAGSGGATGGAGTGGTSVGGAGGASGSGATGGSTGGTSAGGSSGSGGLPTCGGGVCAPTPTGGFSGPFAVIDGNGSSAAACAGDYPNEQAVLHDHVSNVPAAACSCTCDGTGVTCTNPRVDAFSNVGCTGANCCTGSPCATVNLAPNGCYPVGPSLCTQLTHAAPRANISGQCSPKLDVNLDNVPYAETMRLCSPTATGACTGGTCVAVPGSPTTGKLCVQHDGDVTCPAPYTNKTHLWRTEDQRSCNNNCSCGQVRCGTLQVYASDSCAGAANPLQFPTGCGAAAAVGGSVSFTSSAPTCAPTGSAQPTGELQQQDTTLCCLP